MGRFAQSTSWRSASASAAQGQAGISMPRLIVKGSVHSRTMRTPLSICSSRGSE